MSIAAEEDDWERAELQAKLEVIKLQAETQVSSNAAGNATHSGRGSSSIGGSGSPAFIMPARLMTRPIAGEINFLQDMSPAAAAASAPAPVVEDKEPIDSAIISAMENPRERMHVLTIENELLNFVKSTDRVMEIPPTNNSFRRLLTYRVAQRFGLTHVSAAEPSTAEGDRCIVIYRTVDTRIPSPLLIDLPTPHFHDNAESPFGSSQNLADAVNEPPKKMLVMKRNPSRGDDAWKKGASSTRQEPSAEDRERAYAEARARIFGGADPDAESSPAHAAGKATERAATSGKEGSTLPASTSRDSFGSAASPAAGGAGPGSGSGSGKQHINPLYAPSQPEASSAAAAAMVAAATAQATATTAATTAAASEYSKSSGTRGDGANGTPAMKKALERDEIAERADPDFSRQRRQQQLQQHPHQQPGGGRGYTNAPPPPHGPQQAPAMQGRGGGYYNQGGYRGNSAPVGYRQNDYMPPAPGGYGPPPHGYRPPQQPVHGPGPMVGSGPYAPGPGYGPGGMPGMPYGGMASMGPGMMPMIDPSHAGYYGPPFAGHAGPGAPSVVPMMPPQGIMYAPAAYGAPQPIHGSPREQYGGSGGSGSGGYNHNNHGNHSSHGRSGGRRNQSHR